MSAKSTTSDDAKVPTMVKKKMWADEDEHNVNTEDANEKEDIGATEDDDDEKEGEVRVHDYAYMVETGGSVSAADVASFIKGKVTPLPVFVRPFYDNKTGREERGKFVVVFGPNDAKKVQHQIDSTQKANDKRVHKTIFTKISPLHLNESWDWPDMEAQYPNRMYIRLPRRMHVKPLRKHLEHLLNTLRGRDLVEPTQWRIEIPEQQKNHIGQCFIYIATKEEAQRNNYGNKYPAKLAGRADEGNLPFVRYLIHNSRWPANVPLLNNDPNPEYHPEKNPDAPQQLEPSYFINCIWEHKNNKYE